MSGTYATELMGMQLELEERMETMRRSVEGAHASGDWQSLRDKTQST